MHSKHRSAAGFLRSVNSRRAIGLSGLLLFVTTCALVHAQNPNSNFQQSPNHQHAATTQGNMQMEDMHHDIKPLPPPRLPALGMRTTSAARLIRLEELEQLALKNNPTLGQASAELGAAKARREQSGFWPNPIVGYTGEEIRGGSFRGGQQGFFLEQDILLGSKLRRNRQVLAQEVHQAELEQEEQKLRVKNAVRRLFYQALAAQEMLSVKRELSRIALEAQVFDRQLQNIGQKDESEVLQTEIEAQEADLAVIAAEHALRRTMVTMAAVVGDQTVEAASVEGRIDEGLPDLEDQRTLEVMLHESPAVKIAQTGVSRADAALARARVEAIPDLRVRAGLEQNRETQEVTGRPVGLQGFAEIGVQLKLFDRNQGNIRASEAELERARLEVKRIELVLRERAAAYVDNYSTAKVMAVRYQKEILPRAQRAYELIYNRYGFMQAAYPQVLSLQRGLYKAEAEYVMALQQVWANAVRLQGFLLSDGLEAPTRPLDVDRPMREFNLPSGSAVQE